MEGSRPLIVELQALSVPTVFGMPRRNASGIDYNRLTLLMAVLEKRAGLHISNYDAYINVVGGFKLMDNSSDLAICMSVASGLADFEMPSDLITVGEIGLSGEIRAVSYVEQRITEAKRLLSLDEYKVYEVAEMVGYTNINYFHNKFKKYVGMSPLNDKRQSKGEAIVDDNEEE